jgi:hypothetical protein
MLGGQVRRFAAIRYLAPTKKQTQFICSPGSWHDRGCGDRRRTDGEHPLREIVRTNDAVLISAIEALFTGAHIPYLVLDQNMSVLEGSIGMLPRRILVGDDSEREARTLLTDAGLGKELRPQAP